MPPVCELKEVQKHYGERHVLKAISLTLEAGKMYSLLGRNGAGKSTLMRILARYEQPHSGYVFLFGAPLDDAINERQHPIGYVSESVEYALPVSLEEYFHCFKSLYCEWDQKRVDDFFAAVDINPKDQFLQLSRGQRLQAAFGFALATRPKILLLDEITSVLDAHGRAYVVAQLMHYLKEGGTVVIATNIITELRHYPDHLCLLEKGELIVNQPIAALEKQFAKLRRLTPSDHRVFSDPSCCEVDRNSDGSISYLIERAKLESLQVPKTLFDRRRATVENYFIYFTRSKW